MRHEIIHCLSQVEDEHTITDIILNSNAEVLNFLLYHLEYASPETKERWWNMLNKLLR